MQTDSSWHNVYINTALLPVDILPHLLPLHCSKNQSIKRYVSWPQKLSQSGSCPRPFSTVQNTTEECLCAYISKNAIRCGHDLWISDPSIDSKTTSTLPCPPSWPRLTIFKSLPDLLSIVLARTRKIFCITRRKLGKYAWPFPKILRNKMMSASRSFPSPGTFRTPTATHLYMPELRQKTLMLRSIPQGTLNTVFHFRSLHSTKKTRAAAYAIPHSQKVQSISIWPCFYS